MVKHHLAKVETVGSSPISRSWMFFSPSHLACNYDCRRTRVAKLVG